MKTFATAAILLLCAAALSRAILQRLTAHRISIASTSGVDVLERARRMADRQYDS